MRRYKRYCKTLQLQNDPKLIDEYKQLHAMGNAWPEITQGMKDVGITDMEIYISGTTLFMIMDTVENFDHEVAMTKLATMPRQSDWEETVSRFQKTSSDLSAKEKWKLIERIYKLEQDAEEQVMDGYFQKVKL